MFDELSLSLWSNERQAWYEEEEEEVSPPSTTLMMRNNDELGEERGRGPSEWVSYLATQLTDIDDHLPSATVQGVLL